MKPGPGHLKKRRANRRYILLSIVLLACLGIAAVVLIVSHSSSRESLAQRIAAINAARAVPAEQNAATLYDQLVASGVFTGTEDDPNLIPTGYATLVKASRMQSCWFPLAPGERCYREHGDRSQPMRRWMFALCSAAQRDVAAGRCDAAAEELACLIRMAGHLQQQPLIYDSSIGIAIETHVWLTLRECVMQTDAPEQLLRVAEAMPPDKLANDYKQFSSEALEVSAIIKQTVLAEQTPQQRIEEWWQEIRNPIKSAEENFDQIYLFLLCSRRGTRTLVGLRRYHDANGRWPESLEEIKTLVPEQALIDPFTEQTFVYKTAGGTFLLYSKGPNQIDENGVHDSKADDRKIWAPFGQQP
jgi:hypothetical protein